MRNVLAFVLCLAAAPALAADAAHPALVELYQSQGCSDCPPADAALARYADRPDWIALTFSVTYWDRLGWKDSFGRPEYTERQYAYAAALGVGVYTPQVIVNGRAAGVGTDVAEVEALAAKADRGASGPKLAVEGDSVAIGAGAGDGEVWLALYEPHPADVVIARGENAGRKLAHRNVVRRLVRLGEWSGAAERLALPPADGLARAVWVQGRGAGPIVAAARGPLVLDSSVAGPAQRRP
jgi:hypothetical protein